MVRIGRIRVMELLEPDFFGSTLNHNIVVVERGPLGGLMMIDTGLPGSLDKIEAFLNAWGYKLEDISDIVVTHWHHDHAGNASEIKRLSGAKIYAHREEIPSLINPPNYEISFSEAKEELKVSGKEFKETIERINGLKYQPVIVDVPLNGGETLSGFKVIHVPGHTKVILLCLMETTS